jgi:RHS repeat-associated protein
MYHERQTAPGVAYPIIYESTDGLRPETILDYQYSVTPSGLTFQGYRRYVLGPDPDEFLAWIDLDNTVRYPHTDREGTAIALSAVGSVAQEWTYDVYGQSAGTISDVGPGLATYPFRYTGQRLDPSTGLYNYQARDYSPTLGRFLQPDPAGVDQGLNLYEYARNDPGDAADPLGLAPWIFYSSFRQAAMDASNDSVAATSKDPSHPEYGTKILMTSAGQYVYGPLIQGTPLMPAGPNKLEANIDPDKEAGPLALFFHSFQLSETIATVHSHPGHTPPSEADVGWDTQYGLIGVVGEFTNKAGVNVPWSALPGGGLQAGNYSLRAITNAPGALQSVTINANGSVTGHYEVMTGSRIPVTITACPTGKTC